MAEKVEKATYYHVSFAKPYKTQLTLGQRLSIGHAYTPFFAFYEGARTYPVNQPDGSILQVKAVRFLRAVRDGQINCPNLSAIAYEVASHYVMLARELIMEEIRLAEFPEAPSRQRCLYAAATLEQTKYWTSRIGEQGTVCSLEVTGTAHTADARLLLGDSEPLSVTRDRARAYWRGEMGPDPEVEVLIVGDVRVTGIDL